jgi:hypothetical protein
LAPRARFELATLRLTAEMIKNLSALSGVAYEKLGAIFPSLVAPTPAPTPVTSEWAAIRAQSSSLRGRSPSLLPTGLPITNRGKAASRSLRDEALKKCGEFIHRRREGVFLP